MTPVYGYAGQLGWGEETVWGTAATINKFQEFISESLKLDIARYYSPGIKATRQRTKAQYVAGAKDVNGEVVFSPWNKGLLLPWKHTLGSLSTATPFAGVYVHTITPAEVLPAGLTFEKKMGATQFHKYAGCRVDTHVLNIRAGQIPELHWNLLGKDETIAGTGATLTLPGAPLEILSFHQAVLTLDAVSTPVYDLDLTINNALRDDDYRTGSLLRNSLDSTGFEVTGRFRLPYDATTQYTKFTGMTAAALVVALTGSLIASTYFFTIKYTLPVVFYNGSTPETGGSEEEDDLDIPFFAVKDTNPAVTIEITNDEATP